jgi:putative hydrolase of HD superfamily
MDDLLRFTKFLHSFQAIERVLYATGQNRRENDVEHSYQLAMLGWYIVASKNLPLDTNKVLKYAMVHDLVEIYAGDTYFYTKGKSAASQKAERERSAAERIAKEFAEFPELSALIHVYEERADPESRFVYALDKLVPIINIYLDGGRTWKEMGVTLDMNVSGKMPKIAVCEEVKDYYDELLHLLRKDEAKYFATDAKTIDEEKLGQLGGLFKN